MSLQNDYHFIVLKQHFPRIALGLELRWASKDLEPFILNLLKDTRDHTRQGFPNFITDALGSLLMTHSKEFPQYAVSPKDMWDINFSN